MNAARVLTHEGCGRERATCLMSEVYVVHNKLDTSHLLRVIRVLKWGEKEGITNWTLARDL